MGTTLNIISPANALSRFGTDGQELSPTGYANNWSVTGATISVIAEENVHPLQYSFKVQPTSEVNNIVLTLNNITSANTLLINDDFQFHARYFATRALNLSTSIHNDQTNVTTVHADTTKPSQWSTGYSPVINAGGVSISFDIQITISNHGGNIFYVSLPTLISDNSFYKNVFVRNLRQNIPSFIWDKDGLQEYPTYPFYKLFHVLTSRANDAAQLYSDAYQYLSEEIPAEYSGDEPWTNSVLTDPEAVRPEFINWLGQFTGSKILRNINVSGAEILAANGIDPDDFVLWQLENAYFGWAAGTVEAVRESVKQLLTGSKTCFVFPGGSSFTINIYTLTSETPGVVDEGDVSSEVLAVAELTRPLGFTFVHEAYDALPFLLNNDIYGLLDVAPLG